ncbi:MAG: structural protein P5 [Bacteroidales bacterium]|nr:structural protein P5 [Bacteroidales bacterium]
MKKWVQITIAAGTIISILAVGRKAMGATFAMKNNNPGNLKISSFPWVGKVPVEKNKDGVFEQFTTPEYGTRAMIKLLINYINGGDNTIEKIITRYAPQFENPTKSYIDNVSNMTGISKTKKLEPNKETLKKLVLSMSRIEHGKEVVDETLFNIAYQLL